jgi:hypothetical protein
MIVAVFKTDISDVSVADFIKQQLLSAFPGSKINFDLEDCDRILRMELQADIELQVPGKLTQLGYYCEAL